MDPFNLFKTGIGTHQIYKGVKELGVVCESRRSENENKGKMNQRTKASRKDGAIYSL